MIKNSLRNVRKTWNALGEQDPLWAVLTHDGTKGNQWDVQKFFATGREEIDEVMRYLDSLKIKLSLERALDFGCGVGRLSLALSHHFAEVTGLDIAPSMISKAKELVANPRCRFLVNSRADLQIFPARTFDFIYCNIVLQHMPPEFAKRYIGEFIRVLRPGGIALFQVPSAKKYQPEPVAEAPATGLRRFVPAAFLRWWDSRNEGPQMEMHPIPKMDVAATILASGGILVDATENQMCGPLYESWRYCVTK